MNPIKLLPAIALALAPALAFTASPALAAHAGAPYTNVDHSNDAGNDTGDSKVDGLNAGQLNENYRGPLQLRAPAAPAQPQTTIIQTPAVAAPPGTAPQ
jgi:hypothetical protein